jgi:putative DNA primase/helicase
MSDLLDYLNATIGDTEGQLHIAVASGIYLSDSGKIKHKHWDQSRFTWSAEAAQAERELLAAAADSDVYVCPYLMHADKRSPPAAVARRIVDADIDGQADPEKIRAIDGFAVASGTSGHAHVYVALSESVPAHWHRTLCRALGDYLGDADAKITAENVLRPPGMLNHKPTTIGGQPSPVEWLVKPPGIKVDPHTLAEILGVTLARRPTASQRCNPSGPGPAR